jgi:hypothetical protein
VREAGHGGLLATVDAERLQRALFTLIKNAIEQSPQGSRVAVRATCGGERVRIQVADDGAGMSHEELEHAFERFYRADESRGRAFWRERSRPADSPVGGRGSRRRTTLGERDRRGDDGYCAAAAVAASILTSSMALHRSFIFGE